MAEGIWLADSGRPGSALAISFGMHGDERPPIDAGRTLAAQLEAGGVELARGRLLLIWANPVASGEDTRWSKGGVDLNRCFSAEALAKEPELYEERRAHEIVRVLEAFEPETLVDFHCTVEPGDPFLMQHPPVAHAPSHAVTRLLSAKVLVADPALNFGGVSLDEWMSTRGRVGICFETGWLQSPDCTPEFVSGELRNVLAGHGMLADQEATHYDERTLLELDHVLRCDGHGFCWRKGVGSNLQELSAGTSLGTYRDGREVAMPVDATLVFPKKKPQLVELGKPLVYLGVPKSAS